jgi:hypothetical protein
MEFLDGVIAEEKEEHRKRNRRRSAKSLNAKSDKFPRNGKETSLALDLICTHCHQYSFSNYP